MVTVGWVNKYENRSVATHLVREDGKPACGARVDTCAWETEEQPVESVDCGRCRIRAARAQVAQ